MSNYTYRYRLLAAVAALVLAAVQLPPGEEQGQRRAVGSTAAENQGQGAERVILKKAGRVLDLEGRPVAGLLVEWNTLARVRATMDGLDAPPVPNSTTAADGSFVLEVSTGGWLQIRGDRREFVFAGTRELEDGSKESLLVVAATVSVFGEVVDRFGNPIEGAYVNSGEISPPAVAALGGLNPIRTGDGVHARTGPDGRFVLNRVPLVPNVHVKASKVHYTDAEQDITDSRQSIIRLALARTRRDIAGRVFLPSGAPRRSKRAGRGASRFGGWGSRLT